jgi:hypothetical protein
MTGAFILGFLLATGTTLVSLLLGVAYVARRFDDDLL